jgi:DNA polymerase-3 subunit alpha
MIAATSDLVDVAKTSEDVVVFIPTLEEIPEKENMQNEYDLLGYFVTKHPLDDYKTKIRQLDPISELSDKQEKSKVHIGGIVQKYSPKKTKAGKNMAFLTLEDTTGRLEVIVFSTVFARAENILSQNALVEVRGKIEIDEKEVNGETVRTPKIIASFIHPLEDIRKLKEISLKILPGDNMIKIQEILHGKRGDLAVKIEHDNYTLETSYKIPQTMDLINSLKNYCLVKEVEV